MAIIKKLPSALINQIAAGEVIERPSSVVKELIENAIDAKATHISLDIEDGGQSLIRIQDNGSGIEKDDLALAFTNHATSKIKHFDDFEQLNTLGFRGEALASIASISKTTLSSRAQDAKHAYKIIPAQSLEPIPTAHPIGTTIEVRDLFYNTPARKKFLKSVRSEKQHIRQLIEKIALSQENLTLSLHLDGKTQHYGGFELESRINSVLGEDFLQNALPLHGEDEDMQLHGHIALPHYHHHNSEKQYLFINRRIIRDKLISHAVKQAYEDELYHGRHPIYILHLNIDPKNIDVNAHPQKQEVRFHKQQKVHHLIYHSIRNTLRNHRPSHRPTLQTPTTITQEKISTANFSTPSLKTPNIPNFSTANTLKEPSIPYRTSALPTQNPSALIPLQNPLIEEEHPLGYAIGQIHGIFIIAENKNGMILVDMHAAHERILYEKLKQQLHGKKTYPAQKLFLPLELPYNDAQEEILKQHQQQLKTLGYSFRIENNKIYIDSVPELLKHHDNIKILSQLLEELDTTNNPHSIIRLHDKILATISCHSAIRAHHKLSINEMNQLLRDIENTPSASQCNHGRPTWTELNEKELNALFMRGQ